MAGALWRELATLVTGDARAVAGEAGHIVLVRSDPRDIPRIVAIDAQLLKGVEP